VAELATRGIDVRLRALDRHTAGCQLAGTLSGGALHPTQRERSIYRARTQSSPLKRASTILTVTSLLGAFSCAHSRPDGCSLPGKGAWREYRSKHFQILADEETNPTKLVASLEELHAAVLSALVDPALETPSRIPSSRRFGEPARPECRRHLLSGQIRPSTDHSLLCRIGESVAASAGPRARSPVVVLLLSTPDALVCGRARSICRKRCRSRLARTAMGGRSAHERVGRALRSVAGNAPTVHRQAVARWSVLHNELASVSLSLEPTKRAIHRLPAAPWDGRIAGRCLAKLLPRMGPCKGYNDGSGHETRILPAARSRRFALGGENRPH